MLNKLKLFINVCIYRLQGLFGLERSDILKVINDYYRPAFRKLDKKDIGVVLPHCLIGDKCPAKFSKTDGVICKKCDLCGCARIQESALSKGYQFYISPSIGFTKRLANRKGLKGMIGVACDYEIEKGIHSEKVGGNGVTMNGSRVKALGIRLHKFDCLHNDVDWDKIEELMQDQD